MHTDDHPAVQLLLNFKDKEKEATTFGVDWLKHVRSFDGRVHPNWRQLGPATGRMACADPNLQQIPRGECRKGMIAEPGHLLVKADFSQIEARIACKVSGDETMLELFRTNRDIHTYAASQVLRKELHEVTKGDRQIGKSLVFGLLFGMSARSLRGYCRINYGVSFTAVEAELFRDRFFQVFPGLKRWHDDAKGRYQGKREFRTLLGRRRVVINDDGTLNKYGLLLNHPIQGTSADMTKASVATVYERRHEQPGAKLVMIVHDEIVLEAPEGRAVEVGAWLKGIMCEVGAKMIDPVPVDAEVKIGKSWGG
jgi:DNA polymerase-1